MRTLGKARIWKLVLAYDGAEFHGWQVQLDRATVQGELCAAIERVTGEKVLPQGSGRTDAGVHAIGQVASFALWAPIPEPNFARALNRRLPAAIRVLSAKIAPDGFHARHSATRKTYEYRIFREEICPPWLARYVYALNQPLDLDAMRTAAMYVLGQHDFTSFAASDPDLAERTENRDDFEDRMSSVRGNVRTIDISEWILPLPAPQVLTPRGDAYDVSRWRLHPTSGATGAFMPGAGLIYRVRGNGFLHHMVRNLVGTFLEVGRGNLAANDIPAILRARSRSRAGATAPARGLFLTEVEYPEDLS